MVWFGACAKSQQLAWPKVPMSLRRARDLLGAMAAFAGTDSFEEARLVQDQLVAVCISCALPGPQWMLGGGSSFAQQNRIG